MESVVPPKRPVDGRELACEKGAGPEPETPHSGRHGFLGSPGIYAWTETVSAMSPCVNFSDTHRSQRPPR